MSEGVIKVDDKYIVDLFFSRNELALEYTAKKYGPYCYSVAYNIIFCREDAQECVNDTYLAAWNSIPPHKPDQLSGYLAKLTRRISIDRLRRSNAKKRGAGELDILFSELEECVPDENTPEKALKEHELARIINDFLAHLGETERKIFLCRYFFAEPIISVAARFGYSESRVKSQLFRTRKKLKEHLRKEKYYEIR